MTNENNYPKLDPQNKDDNNDSTTLLLFMVLDTLTEEKTEIRKVKDDSTGYTPVRADECSKTAIEVIPPAMHP